MNTTSREFLPALLTCFLISTAHSNVQPSCNLMVTQFDTEEAVQTGTMVTMVTNSDWKSTDLCVCRLSTLSDPTYLAFDLLTPSDQGSSDAICGPYLTIEPTSGGSFYHVCPRSQSSPMHGSTISNQSSITVAIWSRDEKKSLLGANITFHSYASITLTCRNVVNSFLNFENMECPCEVQDVTSPRSISQTDFDLPTRLMRGFVISFSFLLVCGLLLLFFHLNKRFHFTERLKQKLSLLCVSTAAKSVTHRGSGNPAFEASSSYDELPAIVNTQTIDDVTYEKIKQLQNAAEAPNKGPPESGSAAKNLNGSTNSGIYEDPLYSKLRDVNDAPHGDTNSLCPYATFSEVRDSTVRAHLVGRGALSAGDICRWNYSPPPIAGHALKRNVRQSAKEPEAEVIYGTVNKVKVNNCVNGIRSESSTSKQDDLSSSTLGQQQDNDTFV